MPNAYLKSTHALFRLLMMVYVAGLWVLWSVNTLGGAMQSQSMSVVHIAIELVLLVGLSAALFGRPVGFQALWQGVGLFFAFSLALGLAAVLAAPLWLNLVQYRQVLGLAVGLIVALLPAVIIVLRYGFSDQLWRQSVPQALPPMR